jgi:hypothetical protein
MYQPFERSLHDRRHDLYHLCYLCHHRRLRGRWHRRRLGIYLLHVPGGPLGVENVLRPVLNWMCGDEREKGGI